MLADVRQGSGEPSYMFLVRTDVLSRLYALPQMGDMPALTSLAWSITASCGTIESHPEGIKVRSMVLTKVLVTTYHVAISGGLYIVQVAGWADLDSGNGGYVLWMQK